MDVVLRKDAKTHFVEVALIELLERLLVHFFRLVRPRVARGADGIVWRGVFIGEMVRVRNTHRAVVIAGRLRYGEIAGRLRFREAADRFIDVIARKRRHEAHFINAVAVIEAVYRDDFVFAAERGGNGLLRKRVARRRTLEGNFKKPPFFYCIH